MANATAQRSTTSAATVVSILGALTLFINDRAQALDMSTPEAKLLAREMGLTEADALKQTVATLKSIPNAGSDTPITLKVSEPDAQGNCRVEAEGINISNTIPAHLAAGLNGVKARVTTYDKVAVHNVVSANLKVTDPTKLRRAFVVVSAPVATKEQAEALAAYSANARTASRTKNRGTVQAGALPAEI